MFGIPSACPNCGTVLDATTHVGTGESIPSPGDVSICFYCYAVNQFDENMQLIPGAEHIVSNYDIRMLVEKIKFENELLKIRRS